MEDLVNIRNILDEEHSKTQCNMVIQYVGSDRKKMEALMHYLFHDEWRYNQRAAWPIGYIGRSQPELIAPYLEKMIENLDDAKHDAVIRNTIRLFEEIEIPEDLEGQLFDKCFSYLANPKYPIAIRAFSMSVLYRIACRHPALAPELAAEIEEHVPFGSAGFQSRGRKILKLLTKLM